jgi:hypothetical protein
MAKSQRTPEERFWSKVQKTETCWLWMGARHPHGGYGQFVGPPIKELRAHRYSWVLAYGPIPDGLLVCHRCDNPPCVRPDHLFLGTHLDNALDMMAKGRKPPIWNSGTFQTRCLRGHVVTLATSGRRVCRECNRARMLRRVSQLPTPTTKTHCRNGHEYTPENIIWRDKRGRRCRTCERLRWQRHEMRRPYRKTHRPGPGASPAPAQEAPPE